MYRHRQLGLVTLGFALGAMIIAAIGGVFSSHRPLVLVPVALVVAMSLVFSSMTIEIDDGELRHWFGPGVWRKRVPLDDIVGTERVPHAWWEGWGIRVTLRGMLYNVGGKDTIEFRLRSGRRFRLGTDEPDVLLYALREAGVPATP